MFTGTRVGAQLYYTSILSTTLQGFWSSTDNFTTTSSHLVLSSAFPVGFDGKDVCIVYSYYRNDVPRVAHRYGTITAHTRCRASVLVVFVVFCVHMHSFAGLIRRTPPPTFTDPTLIPIFSSSELTGCGYPGLLDWKNRSDMCPWWVSNPRLLACKASTAKAISAHLFYIVFIPLFCLSLPFSSLWQTILKPFHYRFKIFMGRFIVLLAYKLVI